MFDLRFLNPFAEKVSASTEIIELRCYPVKSCRGFSVASTALTMRGLDLDRRWMFVDAKTKKFITIRDIPALTLIDTSLRQGLEQDDPHLVIGIRNQSDKQVSIPARPTSSWLESNTALATVDIWGTNTDGYVYGEHVNSVFSDFLGRPVALVHKGPTARILQGNAAPSRLGRTQDTNFPDALPLQIANESSMKELNSRLRAQNHDKITIDRFRPNIIVRGGADDGMPPWSEDRWKTVRILTGPAPSSAWILTGPSRVDIDVACRCARCQVPNLNPETSEKDAKEPWKTLLSYRRVDEGIKYKPCFGMLCVPRSEGNIRVGMKFEVVETTENHCYVKNF